MSGLSWTVYSLPAAPVAEHLDLGEAEYALRSAVRSAADALGAIRAEAGGVDVADPRRLVEQVLESSGRHQRARPRPVARVAGAGERRAHRRNRHGQFGIDADRAAELVGGADRQRSAAAADSGGALGPAGRGQRDPAVGLAELGRPAVRACTARRRSKSRAAAGASDPWASTEPVRARCAPRRSGRRPTVRIGGRRWGWPPARTRYPAPRACSAARVQVPHHLDVIGDETDRADDHRLGARSARVDRWSATSGSSHGTCGGPDRDCHTWS